MITSIGRMFIKPGSENAAVAALKDLARKVKKEEGTLIYLVHTPDMKSLSLPIASPFEVVFYEVYKDKKSLQVHLNGAFKDFTEKHKDLFQQTNGGEIFTAFVSLNRLGGFVRQ